ncbi:MAG: peroxiredoxin [Polyangiales bacterium]
MTIAVGSKIPESTLKELSASGVTDVSTKDLFAGKKVVLFSVPGAYTPTCSSTHLPGFVRDAEAIRAKGVAEVVCLSVNDPWVMKAWGEAHQTEGKVRMLADGDASFTKALGLEQDLGALLGVRGKRFMMIVDNGVVTELDVEQGKGVNVSGAEHCLVKL